VRCWRDNVLRCRRIYGHLEAERTKSKISAGSLKNTNVVYQTTGDDVKVASDGIGGDGSPTHEYWMQQIARNATLEEWGYLNHCRYVLHDRDTKFCASFRDILAAGGVKPLALPARSPNLNAFAERWVRSVKGECLSKLILFGEPSLRRAVTQFTEHYHAERNHQSKDNLLLFPSHDDAHIGRGRTVACRERLGGLLKYYRCTA
jgi:hypothetical protein